MSPQIFYEPLSVLSLKHNHVSCQGKGGQKFVSETLAFPSKVPRNVAPGIPTDYVMTMKAQ